MKPQFESKDAASRLADVVVQKEPDVTIGMPVRNGGQRLRTVLDSLIGQTYTNFKVIISDNASTDMTEIICREFAQRDKRITYIRQQKNLGLEGNFDFVLTLADTKYFMWAAADDIRSADFLAMNVAFLERNPEFIGSTCPTRFETGPFDPTSMGDTTRDEVDPFERILKFFGSWHANGRIYGLLRTDALRDTNFSRVAYLGGDWALILELLARGKFKRLDTGSVIRGERGLSNGADVFSMYRTRTVSWIIPFFDLSLAAMNLCRRARFRQKMRLLLLLLRLNAVACRTQVRYRLKKKS